MTECRLNLNLLNSCKRVSPRYDQLKVIKIYFAKDALTLKMALLKHIAIAYKLFKVSEYIHLFNQDS